MSPEPAGKKVLDVSVLPLRDIVVFPTALRPLTISREGPLRALAALRPNDELAVFAQRDPTVEQPSLADLYPVGVRVQIVQIADLPDTAQKLVIARGLERVRALTELQREPVFRARVEVLEEVTPRPDDADLAPTIESVHELGAQVISASPFLSNDLIEPLVRLEKAGPLADFVASILPSLKIQVRQDLLETLDQATRLRRVHEELVREMESIRTRMRIKEAVERKVGKAQHEFFLREQLKAIRNELGESTEIERVLEDLRHRLEAAHLPDVVKTEAARELSRLEHLPADAAESGVVRTYLDWLASLPWGRLGAAEMDLTTAQRVLDEDHTTSRRSRSGSSSSWRCSSFAASSRGPSSASSDRPAWVRPPSGSPSRGRAGAPSYACRSAACATRPRFAVTGGPTWARFRGRSSRACAAPALAIRCSCSTRSTSSGPIFAAIRGLR
jgi:ATP-dependent Lon protease